MIRLKDITLVNINCIDPITSVNVLSFCCRNIKFDDVILFSDACPSNITDSISYIKIDNINCIEKYNEFVLKNLNNYIQTKFCLLVQNDGFIINPYLWRSEFLNYDYIGAPWSKHGMRVWGRSNRIGNGGFSLRSKKLMNYIQTLPNVDYCIPEDVTTSLIIEKYNFKYPSVELACKFSLECPVEDYPFDLTKSFGFHGTIIYNSILKACPSIFQND